MAGSAIKIAILANAAQAKAAFKEVEGAAGGLSKKMSSLRGPATAVLAGVGVGAVKSIKAASDLNETVSKSSQIFGSSAGDIDKWANGSAKNLGLSKQAALDSAASFGDMFQQIGFAGTESASLSKNVVQMSADLGSFNNLPTADVSDRISAAFRGEYDSLQTLIPNINAARVESEAMAATGKKSAKELTAQEKATAVLAIVQKDGARAAGDFARTSDGAANSQKIAAATAQDLSAKLGQALLPAYTSVVQGATQLLDIFNAHPAAVTAVVGVISGLAVAVLALSAASTIYNGVLAVARGAAVAYTAVQWLLNAAMTANPIGIIVVGIALLVAGFILLYKKSETFRNILAVIGQVGVAIWGFIKTAALAVWGAIAAYIKLQITIITTVIKAVVAVAKAVWDAIKSAANAVWKAITSVFTSQVNLIKNGFGKIKGFASDVLNKIKSVFSATSLLDAGRKLMEGLARGISGAIGRAVDAVRAGVQKIKNLLPGSPIKDGPLKSWNNGGAGKRLMGFLAYGIDQGSGQVRASMARALDPATSLAGLSVGAPVTSAVGAGPGATSGGDTYIVNFTGVVGDPVAVAKQLEKIKAAGRAAGVRVAA